MILRLVFFCFVVLVACKNEPATVPATSVNSKTLPSSGTAEMAKVLKNIDQTGNPKDHYHWNSRRAAFYKNQMDNTEGNSKYIVWFAYLKELLKAGGYDQTIQEIEDFRRQSNLEYGQMTSTNLLPVLDILALAYLRKGEIDNCIKNHNEHSCTVPFYEEAVHQEKIGSQTAIELYELLYRKTPKDEYKWLLNLAHMTLGQHPDNVPADYLLPFPNWKMENKNFPAFKDVAIDLGIAEDGLSGGMCFDDFNGDGKIDLFMTSYGMLDQCKLFINTGNRFEDKTQKAGLIGVTSGLNCRQADYNNDGHLDILILRGGWLKKGGSHPNSLLKNNGDGTFSDVTKAAGIFSLHPTQTADWADVNKDGYLDLFIGNESEQANPHPSELYINQKDGTFKEQAAEFGLGSVRAYVKGVSFGDINNDQWPDLYISVLGGKNKLFKNNKGKFENITAKAKVDEPMFSFPCWFWDVNNDGYQDIFVSSYDSRKLDFIAADYTKELQNQPADSDKSRLFINNGNETFTERSQQFGIAKSHYTMGSNFGDLDNDGFPDFYLATGAPDLNSVVPNRMYKNNEGKGFTEVTSAGRFGHVQKGHGVGFADFDQDGDQDIYAVMGGAFEGDNFTNVCYQNPINKNSWIVLELEGTTTNRKAVGTTIEVVTDERSIYHTIGPGSSFGGNSLAAEIGLGKAKAINKVIVNWQNGPQQIFEGLNIRTKYNLKEGVDKAQKLSYEPINFEVNVGGHDHHHHHQH